MKVDSSIVVMTFRVLRSISAVSMEPRQEFGGDSACVKARRAWKRREVEKAVEERRFSDERHGISPTGGTYDRHVGPPVDLSSCVLVLFLDSS